MFVKELLPILMMLFDQVVLPFCIFIPYMFALVEGEVMLKLWMKFFETVLAVVDPL